MGETAGLATCFRAGMQLVDANKKRVRRRLRANCARNRQRIASLQHRCAACKNEAWSIPKLGERSKHSTKQHKHAQKWLPPACASGDVEACFQRSLADGTRAAPVAAIEALLGVIERSGAQTMHGLQDELCEGRKALVEFCEQRPACLGGRTELGVSSGCELFLRHVTRTFLEFGDFSECRDEILRRGRAFAAHATNARATSPDMLQVS